ncbi:GTP diphosphokinase [Lysobacteraceae bacterium NML91-0213]|nr:GTP diphosphokinase [Xanthomonadaceae bacterium NML91-0213]
MSAVDASAATLLSLPATAALTPALRDLVDAALRDASGAWVVPAEPWSVVADTLQSLATLNADADVIAAAILHVLPEPPADAAAALARVHPRVAALLEGQRAARQVWALHAERVGRGGQEGLRRLLLAIVRDLRVVPILLARQLAHLRAAAGRPEAERVALARLTRDIHAPLANRLGIWQLKWELEDLAFRYLDPDTYRRIAGLLDDKRSGRERYIDEVTRTLRDALAAQGLHADVAGRPKHIYSIWKKMQRKGVPIGELYDLRAVRVLVDDVGACYAALGIVHALWTPIPSEFDDYIARPKRNDYRSLHTAVVGPEGKTLEVQIRTVEMHEQAELGVAAHWRYKEGGTGDAALERKIEWMRRLLESHQDGGDEGGLAGALDTELVEDRIYTLTPMGEVIDLPRGATPLDFAYHVHTMVGHRCRGAKVNGRIVPLDHTLQSGDRVEVLTGRTAEPRRDWLHASNGYLASGRSRDKVRAWFRALDRERNVQAGRELLDRELRRLGLHRADPAPALKRFHAATLDDLYVLVALGDVGPHQVVRALGEAEAEARRPADENPNLAHTPPRRLPKGSSEFSVVGVDNLLVQIARCCRPLPGEPITGYLTRSRGISVHRAGCAALQRMAARDPQRVLPVEWGRAGGVHEAEALVEGVDRRHLLKDLTNLIAQEDAHVLSIHSEDGGGVGRVRLRLQLRVQDHGQFARLLGRMESLPGIERARRG